VLGGLYKGRLQVDEPVLNIVNGQIMPNFRLPDAAGMSHQAWDFRNRRNLVLIFTGEDSPERTAQVGALLQQFDDLWDEVESNTAVLLVISPRQPRKGNRPHWLNLLDQDARLHRDIGAVDQQGRSVFAAVVADRFGEIMQTYLEKADEFPTARTMIEWLEFIELQCPE